MPPSALTFSLIIPAYNEEAGIAQVINDLAVDLAAMQGQYEVIVVNDGSSDRTRAILQTLTGIRVIEHPRNRGYGAALKTGMAVAKAPLIVITDADGSYPNGQIPHLIDLAQNADMVVGARIGANVQYSALRRIPKWFLVRFAEWLTQTPIPDLNSGLRVFDKQIAQRFSPIFPDGFSFTTSITVAMLMNYCQVHYEPIDYRARLGQSKIRPIRDTLRFVQLILRTGVYFAPMRIFFPIALVLFGGFLVTLGLDIFVRHDLTERSLLLLVASSQTAMFALIADMIDKRTKRL